MLICASAAAEIMGTCDVACIPQLQSLDSARHIIKYARQEGRGVQLPQRSRPGLSDHSIERGPKATRPSPIVFPRSPQALHGSFKHRSWLK